MNKQLRNSALCAFVGIAITVVIDMRTAFFDKQPQSAQTWRYSDFIQEVEKGRVEQVEISPDRTSALVQIQDGSQVSVNLPDDPDLINILTQYQVDFSFLPQTDKFKLLKNLFIAVLFSTYLFFLLRRAPVNKWRRNVELFAFVAIFVVVIGLGTAYFDKQPESREIWLYSDFIQAVERGSVVKVEFSHDNSKAKAFVKSQKVSQLNVYLLENHQLYRFLTSNNVDYEVLSPTIEGFWLEALGILFSLVPLMRYLLQQRTISNIRRDVDQIKAGSDRSR